MTTNPLKNKLVRATDAERCCKEAVRIALQSQRAWFFSALAEIWEPPDEKSVYVMGYATLPKPGVEIDLRQGWRSANATPQPGSGGAAAIIAVGAIVLQLLTSEEARSGVQTAMEMASGAFEAAKDAALRRGQNHCSSCIAGNCLTQSRGRAYRTERIRRRI